MRFFEFISLIRNNKFSVFGTGFVFEMFYQGLIAHGLENQIDHFYVSREISSETFHGIPVSSLSSYDHTSPLLIAVHPANLTGFQELEERSVNIYPFLMEFLYGSPVSRMCLIQVSDILAKQPEDEHWIAARYAGIDGIMKDDAYLMELYIRCISLHSSEATARNRLISLRSLCESIHMHGFDNSGSPVSIDESYRIIDGLHRIAAAAYFRGNSLYCDIYKKGELFDKILTDRNKLPRETLLASGFELKDIEILEGYKKKLAAL